LFQQFEIAGRIYKHVFHWVLDQYTNLSGELRKKYFTSSFHESNGRNKFSFEKILIDGVHLPDCNAGRRKSGIESNQQFGIWSRHQFSLLDVKMELGLELGPPKTIMAHYFGHQAGIAGIGFSH